MAYCILCGAGRPLGSDTIDRLPEHCAKCNRSTRWSPDRPPTLDGPEPRVAYHLEPLDRRLLHAAHIACDDRPVESADELPQESSNSTTDTPCK